MYLPDEFAAISLLAVLMVLQYIWAYYLLKVIYKTLAGGHAEDSRSDDEDEDGPDETVAKKKQ